MVAPQKEESVFAAREGSDDPFDQLDVPATVVCARCGESDCVGSCAGDLLRSGVVQVVPWERPRAPFFRALWITARATTQDEHVFFELLPDGPVAPALRFALACELFASTTALLLTLPVAAIFAPSWLKHVAFDPHARELALRLFFLGIPTLAFLLVLAHAAHGLSLEIGARRAGAANARTRALRFGLYATGWDLVIGPIGFVVVTLREGFVAALRLGIDASGLPTRCARAFVKGAYQLEGKSAQGPLAASYVAAILATVLGAALLLVAAIATVLATT